MPVQIRIAGAEAAAAEAPHDRDNRAVERDEPTPTPIQRALERVRTKQASTRRTAPSLRPVPLVGRKPPWPRSGRGRADPGEEETDPDEVWSGRRSIAAFLMAE